jgi:excisionase family DNA binding protein
VSAAKHGQKRLVNDEEAAAYLAITLRQLRGLAERRDIAFHKVGKHRRYDLAALDRYLDAHLVPANGRRSA